MRKVLLEFGLVILIGTYVFSFLLLVDFSMIFGMLGFILLLLGLLLPSKGPTSFDVYEEYGALLLTLSLILLPAGKIGMFGEYYFLTFYWLILGATLLTIMTLVKVFKLQRDMHREYEKTFIRFHKSFIVYSIGYASAILSYLLFKGLDVITPSILNFQTIGLVLALILIFVSTIFEVFYWFFFLKILNNDLQPNRSFKKILVLVGVVILMVASILSLIFIVIAGLSIFGYAIPFIDLLNIQITNRIYVLHIVMDVFYFIGFLVSGVFLMQSAKN